MERERNKAELKRNEETGERELMMKWRRRRECNEVRKTEERGREGGGQWDKEEEIKVQSPAEEQLEECK